MPISMGTVPGKIKIIFLSSSEFGLAALRKLAGDGRFLVSSVITLPDKPKGRHLKLEPSSIKKEALKLGLKVLEINDIKDKKLEEEIKRQNPDALIMASFGKIIPAGILKIPPYGILNIHPSLLPKFRGPSPIQSAILEGVEKTGVTIMLIDERMDAGQIIGSWKLEVRSWKIGYKELHKELAELGANAIGDTAADWVHGKIKPRLQDESKTTYTKKIRKEDGLIDWNEPAEIIERKIRAFEVWPTCYFFLKKDGKMLRVQILKAEVICTRPDLVRKIGQFFEIDNDLAVQTGQGILKIIKLKPEGKKEMGGEEFIRGYRFFID